MKQNQLISDDKTGSLPNGIKTAAHLESIGVTSPPLERMIKINPGTWISAPANLEGKQLEEWKQDKLFEVNNRNYGK